MKTIIVSWYDMYLVDLWNSLSESTKKKYGSFNNFKDYHLSIDKPDYSFIPTVQVYVVDDEDLEMYGD